MEFELARREAVIADNLRIFLVCRRELASIFFQREITQKKASFFTASKIFADIGRI